ncbi:MAG: hypothetical protein QME96_13055, partial [Myxococcota bacterium]|nr:hypothetical protein [Myxococcota bacterium]
ALVRRRRRPGRIAAAGLSVAAAVVFSAAACSSDVSAPPRADADDTSSADDGTQPPTEAGDVRPDGADLPPPADAFDAPPEADVAPPPLDECAAPRPEWVFCSGFEEGSLDIWDDYDGNPPETNRIIEDPGPFGPAGNHVGRLRVPPGRGGADLVKVLPTAHDRLYARWYIQWEPGFDFEAPNHGGGLHAGHRNHLGRSDHRPRGDDWFTAWIEPLPGLRMLNAYVYYRGMYMDCVNPSGACWGDHFPCMFAERICERPEHRPGVTPPVLEAGRWYCVEMLLDGGTPSATGAGATGALDWWIDGLEVGPWENLWMRTSPDVRIGILWLSLFHHGEHSVEGVMYDRVVVSTARIGCP